MISATKMMKPHRKCENCGKEMNARVLNKVIDYPLLPVMTDKKWTVCQMNGELLQRGMTDQEVYKWKDVIHMGRLVPNASDSEVYYECSCGNVFGHELPNRIIPTVSDMNMNDQMLSVNVLPICLNIDYRYVDGMEPQEIVNDIPYLSEMEKEVVQSYLDSFYCSA